jgi:hypothetical protein
MIPRDLFLILNLRLRLDDSISIIASILKNHSSISELACDIPPLNKDGYS